MLRTDDKLPRSVMCHVTSRNVMMSRSQQNEAANTLNNRELSLSIQLIVPSQRSNNSGHRHQTRPTDSLITIDSGSQSDRLRHSLTRGHESRHYNCDHKTANIHHQPHLCNASSCHIFYSGPMIINKSSDYLHVLLL